MGQKLDPTTATRQYLNDEISPRDYVEALRRYVPSSEGLLQSLDENPEYVARLVESLERAETSDTAKDTNGAADIAASKP
ncbi:MAG TPA: hypothetical protein VKQ30_24200 [Ktedonobacterales bacterium]|nr:hypothetical protein [Ktedonobacterales bacterium]